MDGARRGHLTARQLRHTAIRIARRLARLGGFELVRTADYEIVPRSQFDRVVPEFEELSILRNALLEGSAAV